MATRANLIATYNANPTLQSRYTLQQYLDMFGFGAQTPTLPVEPTDPNDPVKPEEGIPNIINKNLYQGGGDGPPPGPTFNKNDLLGTSDYQGTGPGFFESIMGIPAALANAYTQISPINFARNLFSKEKKAFENRSAQMVREELARQAAAKAEREAFLAQQQRTNIASQLGGPDGTSGGQYRGGAAFASANPYGGSGTMDDLGADSFKDGGRVGLENGGFPTFSEEDFPFFLQDTGGKPKPSLDYYDKYQDSPDDEYPIITIPMGGKLKKPKKKKKKEKKFADGGRVYLYNRLK